MSDSFQKKIKKIDKNIAKLNSRKLNLKDSLKLLKETTNLLSSANDLILSQHNTISEESNEFLLNSNLEKYYKELVIRKKTISDITQKYNNLFKYRKSKSSIISEENIDEDSENNSLLNKENEDNYPIELELVIDKNERLMKKSNKDLEDIANDMGNIKNNLYMQGKKLEDLSDSVDVNEKKAKNGEIAIKDIASDEKSAKLSLTIINILLFVLIMTIIIYKAL